jgi:hypothetical protein
VTETLRNMETRQWGGIANRNRWKSAWHHHDESNLFNVSLQVFVRFNLMLYGGQTAKPTNTSHNR